MAKRVPLRVRRLRTRRAVPLLAVIACLGLSLTLTPAANAVPQTKYYSVTANWPTKDLFDGVPATVVVAFTNDNSGSTTSTQPFGSAQLAFGSLVTLKQANVCAVGVSPGSSACSSTKDLLGWSTSTNSKGNVTFTSQNGVAVQPGQSLLVQVTLVPTAPQTPLNVGTTVKQANNFSGSGNDFILTNANPSIDVVSPSLSFATEPPADVAQSLPMTTTTQAVWNDFCPAVQLTPAIGGVSITLNYVASSGNPGLYFDGHGVGSSGIAAQTSSAETGTAGLATFGSCGQAPAGMEATAVGSGYQLVATLTVDTSVSTSSSSFDVVPTCVDQCTQTSGYTKTTGTVVSSGKPFQAYFSFTAQTAGSSTDPLACSTSVTQSGNPISPLVTSMTTTAANQSGTITLDFPKSVMNDVPNNGTPLMPVCAGADSYFPGSNSSQVTGWAYPYMGLLYDCTDSTITSYSGDFMMCVQSRSRLPGAGEEVVIYTSDVSDPMFW